MDGWKLDPNKRAMAIGRRSSSGQKDNTSGDTQDQGMLAYGKQHELDLIINESIIETAFVIENRKKYRALMELALSQGIKHIIFGYSDFLVGRRA